MTLHHAFSARRTTFAPVLAGMLAAPLLLALLCAAAAPASADAGRSGQASYYVEFRGRMGTPGGHSYLVLGSRRAGHLQASRSVGFYPKGDVSKVTLMSSAVPGVVGASPLDRAHAPLVAYRVKLSGAQYRRLVDYIARARRQQPAYKLFSNNCNDFARQAAYAIGLKAPDNTLALSPNYIANLQALNEGPALQAGTPPLARSDIDNARAILQGP
jgi:hypothetical protein